MAEFLSPKAQEAFATKVRPAALPEELQATWQDYHERHVELLSDILGIYEAREEPPKAIVSIDLCEVLRGTKNALLDLLEIEGNPPSHLYGKPDYAFFNRLTNDEIASALQHLMDKEKVLPPPGYEEIGANIRQWRQLGAICVANTSTLEGSEIPTIKFLADQYPGCFDGIVFPRNYDGKSRFNKGLAHQLVTKAVGVSKTQYIPHVFIEDTIHHTADFLRENPPGRVFMPVYQWNNTAGRRNPQVTTHETPLATFEAADTYLKAELGEN